MHKQIVISLLFLSVLFVPSISMAAVNMQPYWVFENTSDPTGINWIPRAISLGNYGSEVFSAVGTDNHRSRIFSSYDQNSVPMPVQQTTHTGFSSGEKSDSSLYNNIHASFRYKRPDATSDMRPRLEKYSGEDGLIWSYDFPFTVLSASSLASGVGVSTDGEFVAGWAWNPQVNDLQVVRFVGNSGIPVLNQIIPVSGNVKGIRISEDARLLYVDSGSYTKVVDLETGQIIYSKTNFDQSAYGHAISGDGKVIARETNSDKIEAFKWNSQTETYDLFFTYTLSSVGVNDCNNGLELSKDGSFLVASCLNTNNNLTVKILGFDLGNGGVKVLEDTTTGVGQYPNGVSDISISKDKSVFAVGLWGDELFQSPVLRVYIKNSNNWSLYGTYNHNNTLGSANKVEINAKNGVGTIMLASKGTHANAFGSGGSIKLFHLGDSLNLIGTPYTNQTSTFEFEAPAGAIMLSTGLAPVPTLIPSAGWLHLDPTNLIILPPSSANGQGIVEIPYNFTQSPGTQLYAQHIIFTSNGRRLPDQFIKVPVY